MLVRGYDYCMAIESPQYNIIEKDGQLELREYSGYITATVEVQADSYNSAGSMAFSTLADYIFGNNTKRAKISMTAPVISSKPLGSEKIAMTAPVIAAKVDDLSFVISFTMPSNYTMEDLPKPKNKSVSINNIAKYKAVVIRFSGYTTEAKIDKKVDELRQWAKKNHIKLAGEPSILRYDAPWKPGFMRRNEISIKVKY